MAGDTSVAFEQPDLTARILCVLEEVTTRRLAGEQISDETILASHPDLLPALTEKLQALRSAERARQIASDSTRRTNTIPANGVTALPELAEPPPDFFQGYEIREEIGRGAMGVVYRAYQISTGRDVAIKVMLEGPFATANDRSRFEREARILAQLKHPNVVTVYDTGVAAGRFYIVMDLIAGRTLDVLAAERNRAARDQMALFAKICETVGAAHLRGVIHRDLKPSNIRVSDDGEPHVLDFGLAKASTEGVTTGTTAHTMTMTGQFIGSLPWASPEQAEGHAHKVDLRTDVYALGVICYQLLTGHFPYPVVGHIRSVVDNILTVEPRRPSTLVKGVDDDVDTIVLKCLSKDPERRYQTANELARDVRRYLAGEPIEAKRDSGWYVLRKSLRRHKAVVGIVGTFVTLVLAFAVTMSVMYQRSQQEADRAKRTLTFLQDTLFEVSSQRRGAGVTLLEVLDDASRRLGTQLDDQPEVAAALHYTIGYAYETIWKPRRSAAHLETSLRLYTRALGRGHPDTVRSMVLLGMVLGELRDPRAVELQEEALAIRLEQYGERHVLIADSKNELAYALWRTSIPRRWDEAERYYAEALSLYRACYGEEHADIARCLQASAAMYHALGRFDEAVPRYRQALAMSTKLLDPEHQFIPECMMGYAIAMTRVGNYDEAEAMLKDLLTIVPQRFGPDALPEITRLTAELHLARQDFQQARAWINKTIEQECRLLVESNPEAAARLTGAIQTLGLSGSSRPSAPAYQEILNSMLGLGADAGAIVQDFYTLAQINLDEGMPGGAEVAESQLKQAVHILGQSESQMSLFHHAMRRAYGACLIQTGKWQEAEPVLLATYEALDGSVGGRHPLVKRTLRDLVDLYEAWGKPEKAAGFAAMF